MENILNEHELKIAGDIINVGLSKAADSLSFFTKEKVNLSESDIQIKDKLPTPGFAKEGEQIILLTTQIRGDMEGFCYLIFNDEEADKLAKISLPESMYNNKEMLPEMRREILLEADNIITASVVTQFSNLFQKNMHGYIPLYKQGTKAEIENSIKESTADNNFFLHFKAHLDSSNSEIVPEFLWVLNESFIDSVKVFVGQDESMSKLKEMI